MDTVARLMRAIIAGFGRKLGLAAAGAILALFGTQCHAYGSIGAPTSQTVLGYRLTAYSQSFDAATLDGAKALLIAYRTTQSACGTGYYFVVSSPGVWELRCGAVFNTLANESRVNVTVTQCSANSINVSGTCICVAGYKPNTGATACEAQNSCQSVADTLNATDGQLQATGGSVSSACYQGCTIQSGFRATGPLGTTLMAPFTAGAVCNGSGGTGTDTTTPQPAPIPKGKCPGTFNGNPVVVDCSSTAATGSAGTTTAPAGSASAPAGTTTGTTSKETTCTGPTCATTTTTRDVGGNVIKVEVKTEEKGAFCQENPGLSICKNTSFGGSCNAVTCDGDAVQCAIARDQYARNCAVFDTPSDASAAGLAAVTAGSRPSDHPYLTGTTVNLGGGFDQTDLLAGSSCPTDYTISFAGATLTVIPFSVICPKAAMLGNILVGLTALSCIAIVFVRGS